MDRTSLANRALLSYHHRSELLRKWLAKGKPEIVLVYGFHDGKMHPAETVTNLVAFLKVPIDSVRMLKVLDFFGMQDWPEEAQEDWRAEFTRRDAGKVKTVPIIVEYQSTHKREEYYIMGDINPEEARLILEANLMSVSALLERVRKGNDRLMEHYAEIMPEKDTDTWNKLIDNFLLASGRLSLLCDVLASKGYRDCLYMENGKRTRTCLTQRKDTIVCWACPSDRKYWSEELFGTKDLPVYRSGRGAEVMKFLKEAGKWKEEVLKK
ncbi:MAG: hypothetical protein PHN44_00565 [Candidatus Marinimicrobia bacterium]|nr:hypothetical protein [Candidatus Neomarinimicrobiota bacterium]MDD5539142.1 hypothetical protein [Candidatus Neomarinimicrobiota bacterium]